MFTLYISTIYDDSYAIEVEVIDVVRQKLTVLQSTMPITLQLTTLDKMAHVPSL